MRTDIPIKKSKKEIEFYKEHGPKFGKILYGLFIDIGLGALVNGAEIEHNFKKAISTVFAEHIITTDSYSFTFQKSSYYDSRFGHACCVSINDTAAHGIPNHKEFKEKDIISVDCGFILDGPIGKLNFDAGFTVQFGAGNNQPDWIFSSLDALKSILNYQPKDTYQTATLIESIADRYNLSTVVKLSGHGIGRNLHEEPLVRNLSGKYPNSNFFDGLCFCAEPIFVLKDSNNSRITDIYVDSDGWSIKTVNGQPATHFETMFCIENKKVVDLCKVTELFTERGLKWK